MSTLIRIGLENDNDGRSIAWDIDHPGCFAYGKDGSEALVNVPWAVVKYQAWIARHTPDSWLKTCVISTCAWWKPGRCTLSWKLLLKSANPSSNGLCVLAIDFTEIRLQVFFLWDD